MIGAAVVARKSERVQSALRGCPEQRPVFPPEFVYLPFRFLLVESDPTKANVTCSFIIWLVQFFYSDFLLLLPSTRVKLEVSHSHSSSKTSCNVLLRNPTGVMTRATPTNCYARSTGCATACRA